MRAEYGAEHEPADHAVSRWSQNSLVMPDQSMEPFETRLLVSKNEGECLLMQKAVNKLVWDCLLLFPKNTVLLAFLTGHHEALLEKHQCMGRGLSSKLQLTESTLTTQGSAFEHTNGKDCLQKPIRMFARFSKPLTNTPTRWISCKRQAKVPKMCWWSHLPSWDWTS